MEVLAAWGCFAVGGLIVGLLTFPIRLCAKLFGTGHRRARARQRNRRFRDNF